VRGRIGEGDVLVSERYEIAFRPLPRQDQGTNF